MTTIGPKITAAVKAYYGPALGRYHLRLLAKRIAYAVRKAAMKAMKTQPTRIIYKRASTHTT